MKRSKAPSLAKSKILHDLESQAPETTKYLLLKAATKLFAAKGYAGTVLKDIADEADVNISLISYHFDGKEGLYRSCLDRFGKERLELAERILRPAENYEEIKVRLQMFIEQMLSCFVDEPDLTMIIHRECELGLPVAKDIFATTFQKVFECLVDFFKSAVKRGILRGDVDPFIAASLLLGSLNHLGRMNSLNQSLFSFSIEDAETRRKLESQILPVFLEGLRTGNEGKNV
ncbi:MAG: TetR/AcrR family transcriptional regulator [Bdellovibrionales bacterium]